MKIQDSNALHGPAGAGVGGPDRARGANTGESGATRRSEQQSTDGDRVQLSGASQILQNDVSERLDRVAQLQAAYQSGKYHPDDAAAAAKIIEDALDDTGVSE